MSEPIEEGTYPSQETELLHDIRAQMDKVIELLQAILDKLPGRPGK